MKQTLFLALTFTCILSSFAQTISHTVQLTDGRTVDTSHIFLENDNGIFFTEPSNIMADWNLKLYTNSEQNQLISILKSDEPSNSFTIDINSIDWNHIDSTNWMVRPYHFTYDNDSSVYYKGIVHININGIPTDQVEITFNLAPSTPQILDVTFEYEYDWNDDMIFPNGDLYITIQSQRADIYTALNTTIPFCFEFPKMQGFLQMQEFPETNNGIAIFHSNYADWGEFYTFKTSNHFGTIWCNDTILTTDYITDPDILARIEELKNESESIEEVSKDNEIKFINRLDYLVVEGDRTTVTCTTIFDMTGRTIITQNNGENLYIKNLQKGCYIVTCQTKQNKSYIFKFVKS